MAAAAASSVPAAAQRALRGAEANYVRARAAQARGEPDEAARSFAQALAAEPGNQVLAAEALRQAMQAGDWTLARSAAATLDRAGALPAEGLLWSLADAARRNDWRAARAVTERIGANGAFPFLLPVARAWIAFAERGHDPIALLANPPDEAARSYWDEHRALLLLATKQEAPGAAAIAEVAKGGGGRAQRIRLAGAARLAQLGERKAAADLLTGDDEPLAAGRRLLAARKTIPGAVDSMADGMAELFVRFAVDLQRERVTPLAVSLARLATYMAPDNSETWLVTSELLAADNQIAPAIAALSQVMSDDPFAGAALGQRAQLLVRSGDRAAALAQARGAAERPGAGVADLVRYGDLLGEVDRHAEAAPVYARAIALREGGAPGPELWLLHLLRGAALEEADAWPDARAALEAAYRIAPAEPQVLNYLGYAQLERRENLDAAEKLIREASRLAPDDASITDSLGWALFRRGKTAEAVATLERASAADPRQAAIGEHLGDAYWGAGRRVDARYAWSAALLHADTEETKRLQVKLADGWSPAAAAP